MGRKKKIVKYIFPAIGLLAVLLTILNLYLSNRLERYLKVELSQRTAEATDGFYNLTFDDLSIGFVKGELKIEGVRLMPDSTVFQQWKAIDSLPRTYVKAEIGVIDFKGVNLTWRWSYKELHFNSFEIKDPRIEVFDSYYSGRMEKKIRHAETKSLYEVISPYINVLSVRTLNLSDASVFYTVENPVTPIVYGLDDVSFRAYGFLLDKNSSQSGKLLYCDNFEFVTNQPQTLLANNDFLLRTDSIKLSTQDSIIYIEKIRLIPQDSLWTENKQRPDSYVDAQVKTVEVNGVHFKREEALNYLTARSFEISSSDIQIFNLAGNDSEVNKPVDGAAKIDTDSLVQALSLYDIISPVLHSVSIKTIGIDAAKVTYSQAVKDSVEVYKLDNFNFQATGFLIDSLAEEKHGLWYSQNFAFEATGISGNMTARNHRFDVERMALDTESGDFSIEKIRLKPISVNSRKDYMSGSIDTLAMKGLLYDKGISADLFKIDRPVIYYYKSPSYAKKNKEVKAPVDPRADVESILNPLLQYLSIKRIDLNHAYVTLNDRSVPDPVVYKLKDFNFYATRFLVNDSTNRSGSLFFACDHFGFSFSDFDNYLPGKAYRLAVRKGNFSTSKGVLSLQDVKLLPQDSLWQLGADSYISVETPMVYATGLSHLPQKLLQHLDAASLHVESPDIRMLKKDGSLLHLTLHDLEIGKIAWDSLHFSVGSIDLSEPVIRYQAGNSPDTIKVKKKSPLIISNDIYEAVNRFTPDLSLGKLNISNAVWDHDTASLFLEGLHLNTKDRIFGLKTVRFDTRDLAFPLDNGFYTLKIGKVNLDNTDLNMENIHLISTYPKMEFAYRQPKHQDWFDIKVGKLGLSGIDLPAYFSEQIVRIKEVQIDDAELQNFKNQQIAVPRHIVPMIYSGLQKAPVKVAIDSLGVNNLTVVYEELSKKGIQPGKLFFTEMNGKFSGFTNIASRPDQYIRLDANGKLMGKGYFTATWMLPVDSLNDRFLLDAHLADFDLTALNELITPLAFAKVESGRLTDFTFSTEASTKGATVEMLFLYRDLKAEIMKEKNGEVIDNKFLSRLANLVLKHDNPDHPEQGTHRPRYSQLSIERDPYHSTFNYLWQILRPALTESVGVSKKAQDVAKGVTGFFTKVKNFFHPKKKNRQEVKVFGQNEPDSELIPD
ncbi:DUF748 domain-containing protein [Parabacteroides sp. AF18-52]|jgi:Domain of Unknown Function (DUF748).|uniref:DUF748 domain-containing protein n=1 Tax=Parabacteroides TaxID=375288 RepID=UPI000EFEF69F|nr:DUF748 domain-containing protein [Parabacteroides sp. AF18-52]RHR37495.1 DUF748 domain-containing protein [Parabacteroides sp. AF18-52]